MMFLLNLKVYHSWPLSQTATRGRPNYSDRLETSSLEQWKSIPKPPPRSNCLRFWRFVNTVSGFGNALFDFSQSKHGRFCSWGARSGPRISWRQTTRRRRASWRRAPPPTAAARSSTPSPPARSSTGCRQLRSSARWRRPQYSGARGGVRRDALYCVPLLVAASAALLRRESGARAPRRHAPVRARWRR